MKKMAIVVIYNKDSKKFFKESIKLLSGCKYPVYIVVNEEKKSAKHKFPFKVIYNPEGGYELGALKKAFEVIDADEIFLLQSTSYVKDQAIFDIAASCQSSFAVCKGFYHFMGKYKRDIIEVIGIPIPKSKKAAILHEFYWHKVYVAMDPFIVMCEDALSESNTFEEKFGRNNMILENQYIKKYKGNWGQLDVGFTNQFT